MFFSVLRLDRLVGERNDQNIQIISDWASVENFEAEIRRIVHTQGNRMISVIWLLFSAIEFYDWAVEKGVSEPERLFPLMDDLAEGVLDDHYTLFNLSGSPLFLYALHNYFVKRGFEEKRIQVESYIEKLYLHRSDGSEMDLQGKALMCNMEKRAGIHKDYLMENGLLFPDYEEFEERTTSEDAKRIQECEERYQTALEIHPYFEKEKAFHLAERATIIEHYSWILFVLYKVFGKEAVRNFVRHNLFLYKIESITFIPQAALAWLNVYWSHIRLATILKDVYEDDVEWQVEWQSVIDEHKEELSRNLLVIYANKDIFSLAHITQFVNLFLLAQE